ncbi:MAG: PfkB family carbohydrate kinase [Chloroflexi bacterium]|nr:PfkB family carbohydrate kinase [Chloroflexota bacterium]
MMRGPAGPAARPRGCFVGLGVLDIVHLVDRLPGADEKIVARAELVAAGGPAANAAAAFAWAGGRATLVSALGRHPLAQAAVADLRACGVRLEDRSPGRAAPPPVAAILVTATTGERAVVSSTDRAFEDEGPSALAPADVERLLRGAGVILADGHHAVLARALLAGARERGIVTVLDAGTWRPAFDALLALADVVVASAAFRPPEVADAADAGSVLEALLARGAAAAARTDGPRPVRWRHRDGGRGAIQVPGGPVADTLAAGDVFHGIAAFLLAGSPPLPPPARFEQALVEAARVATASCATFGTRAWRAAPIDPPPAPTGQRAGGRTS